MKLFKLRVLLIGFVGLGALLFYANDVYAIKFTESGDYVSSSNTNAVIDQIGQESPDFHLALGDISYGSNDDVNQEANWCAFVHNRLSAQGIDADTFPFQLIAGNHEDDAQHNGFINDFASCLPDRMSSTGSYADHYYFDSGNIRVIMISPSLTVNGNTYNFEDDSAEYQEVSDWIDEGRSGGADWIVVGLHRNCITVGKKPSCEIGTNVMDLLIEKKVDIILHGHDHTYQRTEQLTSGPDCTGITINGFDSDCINSEAPSNVYEKGLGPVDLVVGLGGRSAYAINHNDSESGYFLKASGSKNSPSFGNLVIDISGNELVGEFKAAKGSYSDKFKITDSNQYLINDFDTTTNLIGDFNGDGKDDVAYARQTGDTTVWKVAKSNGNRFGTSTLWSGDFGNAGDSFYVGDFNGDGKDDIAYSRASGDTISWHTSKSTGSHFSGNSLWASDLGNNGDRFFIGKFSRDRKADIAIMRASDDTSVTWHVSRSHGTFFESSILWSNDIGDTDNTFRVGDFNGDNRDDLVNISPVKFNTMMIQRSLSNGSDFGTSSTWKDDFGNDGDRYRVGDFNGDNRDDLTLARGTSVSNLEWKVGISLKSGFIDDGIWKIDFGNSESIF